MTIFKLLITIPTGSPKKHKTFEDDSGSFTGILERKLDSLKIMWKSNVMPAEFYRAL